MKILILKFGASGDVVRTTPLLHLFKNENIDWITSDQNAVLLNDNPMISRVLTLSNIKEVKFHNYDLIINLEDNIKAAQIVSMLKSKEIFGCYLDNNNKLVYTEDSAGWFDMSLISRYGKDKADELKFNNKLSFQEIIFKGLGYNFVGEQYILPKTPESYLIGDIAIAPTAGERWPMKNWAFYNDLISILIKKGWNVNVLPHRPSLLMHLADIKNHKLLISGDSLPMHLALGSNIYCITLFLCTSASEIYDYGIQKKIISPYLKEFFYKNGYSEKAVKAISLDKVLHEFNNFKISKEISLVS
ncbi:glycosyltransferase family 9 protein [Melioribacter sp. OK-6-Me]|uniref:glycosyltransferase family 9 protein n=1 Tax=unclassified Melioribacter TaxID=2627329 RepID=UPI003EDA07B5